MPLTFLDPMNAEGFILGPWIKILGLGNIQFDGSLVAIRSELTGVVIADSIEPGRRTREGSATGENEEDQDNPRNHYA
jgi:hypothetical protein